MSFSKATIVHRFENADGTAASGSITFQLSKRITNGNITLVPASITANLNGSGELSQELTSNVDTGTNPTDSQWRMDWRILGAQEETFYIIVPTGGGTVELAKLLPEQPLGG